MTTADQGGRMRQGRQSGFAVSLLMHASVFAVVVFIGRMGLMRVPPLRRPGTQAGTHVMLSYNAGAPATSRAAALRDTPKMLPVSATPKLAVQQRIAPKSAPARGEAGIGSAGDSALGDENIHIALPQVHPRPEPDLSSLPRGTSGNVVVDVTIDQTGKVTDTTLVKGLGSPIDEAVLKVVGEWTFTPATRNGVQVPSEQEVLIHYERG